MRYAGIVSAERIAGRSGVGAVMGSKRLKAISVDGTRALELAHEEKFKAYTKGLRQRFREHPVMGEKLRRYGTMGIVNTTNARGILPTRNFQRGHHPDGTKLSGEYLEGHGLVGVKSSCVHCPVACGRDVEVEGKGRVKGPEYETAALLGTNLDITDLAFGDAAAVSVAIKDIAHRRGLGNDLAEGVKRLSEKYGGAEFAMHVKGLELSAYDPRGSYAQGVEYATTNRGGCHVQGASMYMESTGPLTINPHSLHLKAELPVVQQNLACAINSMVMCIFTTYGVIPAAVHRMNPKSLRYRIIATLFEHSGPLYRWIMGLKAFPLLWFEKWLTFATGRTYSSGHLQEIGERIFNLERIYNLREGFTAKDDTLPPRILNEPLFAHQTAGHPLHLLLPRYYELRGWDASGVPTRKTLARLKVRT